MSESTAEILITLQLFYAEKHLKMCNTSKSDVDRLESFVSNFKSGFGEPVYCMNTDLVLLFR